MTLIQNIATFINHYVCVCVCVCLCLCCRDQEKFVLLCLQLLNTHLSLALTGGMAQAVLGAEATPLRELLFR